MIFRLELTNMQDPDEVRTVLALHPFKGWDAKTVAQKAIDWWGKYLDSIEQIADEIRLANPN
jgi:hypothetical protein